MYITQKSLHIDQYFGFDNSTTPEGRIKFKSAVAAKADHIRLIGRETVRLYCGSSQTTEGLGPDGETNTIGTGGIHSKSKIELVVNNDSHLQPAVLGTNLVAYLESVEEHIKKINLAIQKISGNLIGVNSALGVLTLGNPYFLSQVPLNTNLWTNSMFSSINVELRKLNSLNSLGFIQGAGSVVSNSVFLS